MSRCDAPAVVFSWTAWTVLLSIVSGCSEVIESPSWAQLALTVDLQPAIAAGQNVTAVHAVVECWDDDYDAWDDDYQAEMYLDLSESSATGTFEDLLPGEYSFVTTLFDGEAVVSTGTGYAFVEANSGTTVTVESNWEPSVDVPVLLQPFKRVQVDNGCYPQTDSTIWIFDWTDVLGAERYETFVHGPTASGPLGMGGRYTTLSYRRYSRVAYVAARNRYNWYWRVRAEVGGEWKEWSDTHYFDTEALNTDCP